MPEMTWEEAMDIWRSLPEEDGNVVRQAAVDRLLEYNVEEIGTSDVNGSVYGLIASGEYEDILRRNKDGKS